jgi:hypothetical protein
LLLERLCTKNQHWCKSLDEIVLYEDGAKNAALLSKHLQIVMWCM